VVFLKKKSFLFCFRTIFIFLIEFKVLMSNRISANEKFYNKKPQHYFQRNCRTGHYKQIILNPTHFFISMNVLRFYHTLQASLRTHFPGLVHWSHLPGLVSWFAISSGIVLNRTISPNFGNSFSLPFMLVFVVIIGFGGIFLRSNWFRIPLFMLFGFLLHFLYASQAQQFFTRTYNLRYAMKNTTITGQVVSAPEPYFEQNSYTVRIISQPDIYRSPLIRKKVRCISDSTPVLGSTMKLNGSFISPKNQENPYGFNQKEYFLSNRLWGTFYADSITLFEKSIPIYYHMATRFRTIVMKTLATIKNPDNRAFFQSAFLGERTFLTGEMKNNFRKAGIYHLLAISGLHVGILFASAYFLFSLLPIGKRTKSCCALLIVWLYLLFIGFIPSLFRATIMITFLFGTSLFQRNNYPLHTLGLAGTFWLLLSPGSIVQPGFQLSFGATFGILTIFPILVEKKSRNTTIFSTIGHKTWALFIVSAAGLLATVPILNYHFGGLSLFGLLANLVSVLLMTIGMWCFFTGLLLHSIFPSLSRLPIACAEYSADALRSIAHFADYIPFAWIQLPVLPTGVLLLYILFLIGFTTTNRKRLGRYLLWSISIIFIVTPLLLLQHTSQKPLEIVRFAPSNLDCIGIRWPDRTIWLFVQSPVENYTDKYTSCIMPWLRHNGKKRPDVLCISDYRYLSDSIAISPVKKVLLTHDICSNNNLYDSETNKVVAYPLTFTPYPSCTTTINNPYEKYNAWIDITYEYYRLKVTFSALTVWIATDSMLTNIPVSGTADWIRVFRHGLKIY